MISVFSSRFVSPSMDACSFSMKYGSIDTWYLLISAELPDALFRRAVVRRVVEAGVDAAAGIDTA